MFSIFENVAKSVTNTVSDFVDDPVGTTVDIATQPLRDGLDLLDGLSEGELRTKAALRLGTDVVAGMALSEVIEALLEE